MMTLGQSGLLVLATAALYGGAAADVCSKASVPYTSEQSPFGWPIAPNYVRDEPNCWQEDFVICGGQHQSPVDINTTCGHSTGRTQLSLSGYDAVVGAGASVSFSSYMGTFMVTGALGHLDVHVGGSEVEYEAVQVHLTAPSFHHVDGSPKAAEMLIVHKLTHAANALESAVIVSILFEEHADASPIFTAFGFDRAENPRATTADLKLDSQHVGPAFEGISYFYNGSVPVPPCHETVKWFVLKQPMPATPAQIDNLRQGTQVHLSTFSTYHRPPVREICAAENAIEVGGPHLLSTCEALSPGDQNRSAGCWESADRCNSQRYSPVDINGSAILAHRVAGHKFENDTIFNYNPHLATLRVTVSVPRDHLHVTIQDGDIDIGYLSLNGHFFWPHSIRIKAISEQIVNGQYYPGEIVIEHLLFGDKFIDDETVEKIMMSVPLKIGVENDLLNLLDLEDNEEHIKNQQPFNVTLRETNVIHSVLQHSLAGPWYWYSSTAVHGENCSVPVRWMVFETPLDVSMEQLNRLQFPVSGVDSTMMPAHIPPSQVWRSQLPRNAVDMRDLVCPTENQSHWSYHSEWCWGDVFPTCGEGRQQSPIHLRSQDVTTEGSDNFIERVHWKPVANVKIFNNGHNIQFGPRFEQFGYIAMVGEDGAMEYYQVNSAHIHMPSEHHVDGKQFPAEFHIVHFKQNAVNELDTTSPLVVGILFDFSEENSTFFDQLFEEGLFPHHLLERGDEAMLRHPIDLLRSFGSSLDGPFFRYDGSLTTPNCMEGLKWFVFETPQKMSYSQWVEFKKIFTNPEDNRPLQPLFGRDIHRNSFKEGALTRWEYYLNRHTGRNRTYPNEFMVLIPIIAIVLLTISVMAAVFQNESTTRKRSNAGGLAVPDTIGKSVYSGP